MTSEELVKTSHEGSKLKLFLTGRKPHPTRKLIQRPLSLCASEIPRIGQDNGCKVLAVSDNTPNTLIYCLHAEILVVLLA